MLELKQGAEVIRRVAPGATFKLPNGNTVSPAYSGWTQGVYTLTEVPTPSPAEVLAQTREKMELSFSQLLIGLVAEGWITEAEGNSWLDGQLPNSFNAMINSLPQEMRFAARARGKRVSVIKRADALVNALAAAQGKSQVELDAFFEKYVSV